MKISVIVFICLIVGLLLSACGGGSDDPYAPREISKEHQGLSLSELKSMASDISYNELIGHPGEGIFFDLQNPRIIENIEMHNGTLIHSEGFVEAIYPSEDKSRLTVWICPKSELTDASVYGRKDAPSSDEESVEEFNCRETLFLLYDLNRGPNLSEGDVMEFAGTIVGGQRKIRMADVAGKDKRTIKAYHPKVSVIKAMNLGVSDWEPPMTEGS